MDLSDFQATDTSARMVISHPVTGAPLTNDEKESAIWVYSQDSEVYKTYLRKQQNRRLSDKNRTKITAEELEAQALEGLVIVTDRFENVKFKGEVLDGKVSGAKIRDLYSTVPAVREQVDAFFADRTNYLKS